jgi:hypothetical protein
VLLLVDSSPSAKAFFPLQHPVRTIALAPLNQKAGPNSHMRAFATNLPLLRLYIDAIDIVSTRIGVLVPTNLHWFSVDEGCLSTRAKLACLWPSFWFPASEARRTEKHKTDGLVIQPVFQKRAAMEKKRRGVSGLAMLSNIYIWLLQLVVVLFVAIKSTSWYRTPYVRLQYLPRSCIACLSTVFSTWRFAVCLPRSNRYIHYHY